MLVTQFLERSSQPPSGAAGGRDGVVDRRSQPASSIMTSDGSAPCAGSSRQVEAVRVRPMSPFRGVAAGESVRKVGLAPRVRVVPGQSRGVPRRRDALLRRDVASTRRGSEAAAQRGSGAAIDEPHRAP
jgi:hypothetical protein